MRDRDDFGAFCRSAHPDLVGALAHHTGDRWLAEELAQEALIRAGQRWDHVRSLSAPVGWCFRVGTNLAASTFRRRRIERRARARRDAADTTGPEDDVAGAEAVREALARLTAAQREVVILRHLLGLDVAETATRTGRSPDAVRALTHRAITTLREQLGPDLLPPDEESADV